MSYTTNPEHPEQTPAPAWFNNRVLEGLQFLWALGLPGTPAAEMASVTASAWIHALWTARAIAWEEQLDSYRLHSAFSAVAATADRWPAPRTVVDAMEPRRQERQLPAPRLPQPEHVRQRVEQLRRRRTEGAEVTS